MPRARLSLISMLGDDIRRAFALNVWSKRARSLSNFKKEFSDYRQEAERVGTLVPRERDIYPLLNDATSDMGYEPHYTYHCAWACRILAGTRPARHVDISSSLMFAAMASAWVRIEHYDYRAPSIVISNLATGTADLTALPFADCSIDSLSCLHVVEHIGLGRYGDPIDPMGDQKACSELRRVLKPGGQLLIAVPVGRRRINFNAHRVYSHNDVLSSFAGLNVKEYQLIPDAYQDGMLVNPPADVIDKQKWGCGCYLFEKNEKVIAC